MIARLFLGLQALLLVPYGVYCFLHPGFLEGAAGIAAVNATGTTELRAMYGGLQVAIGVLALAAALQPRSLQATLVLLGTMFAGLGASRLAGALLGGDWSAYTVYAFCYELGSAAILLLLWARSGRPA